MEQICEKGYFFLDLNLSIVNGYVTTKIYDKRDDFNFNIVTVPFLDGDVPRAISYGVYISQLVRFARTCNDVNDFNECNFGISEKLLKQGYRYHKLRKVLSSIPRFNSKIQVQLKITIATRYFTASFCF